MRLGRLIGTGVLCGLSVVVALIAGEIMVRYLAPQELYRFPHGLFENHPTLGYRLVPGFNGEVETVEFSTHMRVNALGLRADREYGHKGPDTFRMLLLGDSFTMGVGVEQDETYGQVLEQWLRARSQGMPQLYEVINAGVAGYNTQQALTYLRESGLALEPDLVVLGFYIGNDIVENVDVPSISVQDGYLQERKPSHGFLPLPLRHYLSRISHLYHLIWPLQRRLFDPAYQAHERRARQRRLAIYAVEGNDRDTDGLWRATRRQMQAFAEFTRGQGLPLAVVVIPEAMQVNAQLWQATTKPMASTGVTYRANWPNQHLVAMCDELGLPVLDLLPVYGQAASGEPLYLNLDGHWTRRGHVVAATAIDTFLRQRQLVPVGR